MPAACREHPPSAATPGDYDAGKKISGRKTFGVVDTLGLLLCVFVVPVSVSDNIGGIAVIDDAAPINHCAATHNPTLGRRKNLGLAGQSLTPPHRL
jgi:hypothetical protein